MNADVVENGKNKGVEDGQDALSEDTQQVPVLHKHQRALRVSLHRNDDERGL